MSEKKRIISLDFIKAFATVLIIFHHFQQTFDLRFDGINFFGGSIYFGYLVELFFIISGFFAAYTFKDGTSNIKDFCHRFLRIFPTAFLACLVDLIFFLIYYAMYSKWLIEITPKMVICSLLLIFQPGTIALNNPTWYLCVMIQCFIIFEAVDFICRKVKLKKEIVFGILFVIFSALKLIYEGRFSNCLRGYVSFTLGILICFIFKEIYREEKRKKYTFILSAVTAVVAVVTVVMWKRVLMYQNHLVIYVYYPLITAWALLFPNTGSEKADKIISTFGNFSYQAFLWHAPLFVLIKILLGERGFDMLHSYTAMLLVTIGIEAAAYFLFIYLEKPIAGLTRKIMDKIK